MVDAVVIVAIHLRTPLDLGRSKALFDLLVIPLQRSGVLLCILGGAFCGKPSVFGWSHKNKKKTKKNSPLHFKPHLRSWVQAGCPAFGQILGHRRHFPMRLLLSCKKGPKISGWGEVGVWFVGFFPVFWGVGCRILVNR